MAKAQRKARAKLAARRAVWDSHFGSTPGFNRPGSYKKSHPAGRGKVHAPKG